MMSAAATTNSDDRRSIRGGRKRLVRLLDFELPSESPKIAAPLVAAFLLTLVFLIIPPAAPDLDADPAWCGVLTYAHEHHLQFGTEIVFTFGPFGFLIAPYFFGQPAGLLITADLVLSLSIAAGLCLLAWRLNRWWRCLLLASFVFIMGNLDPRPDLAFDIGFFCWGLLCFLETGKRLWVCVLTLASLAAFGALAKMTYLFIGGFTLVAVTIDLMLRRQLKLAILLPLCFGAGIVFGWVLADQRLANLGQFFVNGFLISRDYDQAAGLEGLSTLRERGFWVLVLTLAVAIPQAATAFHSATKGIRCRRATILLWLSGLVFVLWKHSFVRVDRFHVVNLLGFVPVAVLVLDCLSGASNNVHRFSRPVALIGCFLGILTFEQMFFGDVFTSLIQPFRRAAYHLQCIFVPAFYRDRMASVQETFRREAQWPKMRRDIGKASVDVFGTFQAFALLNDLNYHPRPVFQSYAAYNPRLARLNRDFYLSAAAPDYVVFRLFAHDRRIPALNDGPALRELLLNYEPVDSEGVFLLLKSKPTGPARMSLVKEGTVRPGELISLSEWPNQDLWLEIDLNPSFMGRLNQFIYRPPPVRLSVWNPQKSARLARRRVGAPLLSIGGIASPFLFDTDDVRKLYSGRVVRPGAYSVDLRPEDKTLWAEQIRFRIYKIETPLVRSETELDFSKPAP
jgi:hypothetical protein